MPRDLEVVADLDGEAEQVLGDRLDRDRQLVAAEDGVVRVAEGVRASGRRTRPCRFLSSGSAAGAEEAVDLVLLRDRLHVEARLVACRHSLRPVHDGRLRRRGRRAPAGERADVGAEELSQGVPDARVDAARRRAGPPRARGSSARPSARGKARGRAGGSAVTRARPASTAATSAARAAAARRAPMRASARRARGRAAAARRRPGNASTSRASSPASSPARASSSRTSGRCPCRKLTANSSKSLSVRSFIPRAPGAS